MPEPNIFLTADWGARSPNSSNFTKRPAAGLLIHNTQHPNRAPLQVDAERSKAFASHEVFRKTTSTGAGRIRGNIF
jgi:hypothetical protein